MKSGKSYAELEVMIDWYEHQRQIDNGNLIIKTKSKDSDLALKEATKIADYLRSKNIFSEDFLTYLKKVLHYLLV